MSTKSAKDQFRDAIKTSEEQVEDINAFLARSQELSADEARQVFRSICTIFTVVLAIAAPVASLLWFKASGTGMRLLGRGIGMFSDKFLKEKNEKAQE